MTTSTDPWALVAAAQGGDRGAFGQLYELYVDHVFRYASAHVASRELAEDLTAETFLRALRGIRTATHRRSNVKAWLITIARNLIADHYKCSRTRMERPRGHITDAAELTETPLRPNRAQTDQRCWVGIPEPRDGGDPATVVLAALDAEALLAGLAQLTEGQRECVTLRFLHGLSLEETAQVMGRNNLTIRSLQHRGVRRLALAVADAAVRGCAAPR
mgnify:FL=1